MTDHNINHEKLDLDHDIEMLEEQIEDLKRLKKQKEKEVYRASVTPAQEMADLVHKHICHANHTDACGYYYETWDNYGQFPFSARKDWLAKAEKLIKIVSVSQVELVLESIRDLRF